MSNDTNGNNKFSFNNVYWLIGSGHLDLTILGAMQVTPRGDLANWMVPGKKVTGMGGAMDLVAPPRTKVVVTMEHLTKNGKHKFLEDCTLPLTGKSCIDMVITEMGVFNIDKVNGVMTLSEIADGVTVDQVKAATGCAFHVDPKLKIMPQI